MSAAPVRVLWVARRRRERLRERRARVLYFALLAILPAALFIAATNNGS